MGMHTPWGTAQTRKEIAEGIVEVTTASHGGIKLSRERNALVNEVWRCDDGWYEEDCDHAIVVMTFPEAFDEKTRDYARKSARNWKPDGFAAVTGETVPTEESVVLRDRAFKAATADKWVTISAFGDWAEGVPKGHVRVVTTLGGIGRPGERERLFIVPQEDYRTREASFVVPEGKYQEVTITA